jgi:hypothetical protein
MTYSGDEMKAAEEHSGFLRLSKRNEMGDG